MDSLLSFHHQLEQYLQQETFVKLALGHYKGADTDLKNIYIKVALIKKQRMLSFTYRFKTRDIVKNFTLTEGRVAIEKELSTTGFRVATLFSTTENLIIEQTKKGDWRLRKEKATQQQAADLAHDRAKERKLQNPDKPYLQALRLTDAEGKVFKNAQDKWKQINHYVDILSSMLHDLPADKPIHVVDMGAGKGYLTFALYDYLRNVMQRDASVEGVEYRQDLVDLCNGIAQETGFDQLSFKQGTIEDYQSEKPINVLIALHACDTATDDAIFQGLQQQADLIVVAPCCHKQVRREMEAGKAKNELDFLLQHGIFLERQAEMLTDGLRALIMEYHGYQTKVFQFIADAHTPKNVLVVGVRKEINTKRQAEILEKIKSSKAFFGIKQQQLETLTGLSTAI